MSSQTVVPRQAASRYPAFGGNAVPVGASAEAVGGSGAGTLAFWICAGYTFLLSSRTVEFIDDTGRLHLNLISGLLCIIAVIATGTIPKMLISRPGRWINLFCLWIFIGLPFSTWKGGSVASFQDAWIKSYLTFFIVGGLIFTLKQFRIMTVILAFGTAGQLFVASRHSLSYEDDRVSATYGSLGNSNDLASALLIGAPFVLFVMADKKVNTFLRILCFPLLLILLITVLKTGSRGGLFSITALVLFSFIKSGAAGKMKIAIAGFCIVAIFAAVVPSDLRNRYMTIFKTDTTADTSANARSALESSNARRELIKNAVTLTIRHPLFGVGLGQFSSQSFDLLVSKGMTGMWFTCHDIFGLVAAEIGVPGLIFFCGTLLACFRVLSRLSKLPPGTPEQELIARLAYTLMMSLVGFTVSGIFNTQAFSYQLPILASLTAALDRIAVPHIAAAASSQVQAAPYPTFVNRRLAQRAVQAAS
jgi:hypothetical protein